MIHRAHGSLVDSKETEQNKKEPVYLAKIYQDQVEFCLFFCLLTLFQKIIFGKQTMKDARCQRAPETEEEVKGREGERLGPLLSLMLKTTAVDRRANSRQFTLRVSQLSLKFLGHEVLEREFDFHLQHCLGALDSPTMLRNSLRNIKDNISSPLAEILGYHRIDTVYRTKLHPLEVQKNCQGMFLDVGRTIAE